MLFGRYVWNSIDASKLVTRTSGWIGAMARTLWRYYSDVGQRLRSRQSRYLTGGNALIGRLKLSLDKRRVPLWLNTRLIELLRENGRRSEEHTSELQSLMRISYAVFCSKENTTLTHQHYLSS